MFLKVCAQPWSRAIYSLSALILICAISVGTVQNLRVHAAPTNAVSINSATITGEPREWHKITLMWDGPNTSETATPNPFLDYRLDVTFTNDSKTYTVPGYFCADGNVAESSAISGSQWCVHFAPDSTGTWTYRAAFTSGSSVAINGGGASAGFFDGDTGSFTVNATNKSGRDF